MNNSKDQEYKTVRYDALMWITDPAGQARPPALETYTRVGWTVVETQQEENGKVTYLLQRHRAIGKLEGLLSTLEGACRTQFEIVHKQKPPLKVCPYCPSEELPQMKHEYNCPYGTLMRITTELREKLEEERWHYHPFIRR